MEAGDYDGEDFADLEGVIAGCPTWNTGADEYRSGTTWDDYLDTIKEYDLDGKVVAIFGCGDSQSYADNFCDGIEELHNAFQAAGAKMVGYVDVSGYSYGESKSVKDRFSGFGTAPSCVSLCRCYRRTPFNEECLAYRTPKSLRQP